MSLRTAMLGFLATLAALALLGTGQLLWFLAYERDSSRARENAVASIRVGQDLEVALLNRNRLGNLWLRTGEERFRARREALERSIATALREAEALTGSEGEARLLDEVRRRIGRYLEVRAVVDDGGLPLAGAFDRSSPALDAAVDAVEAFVQHQVEEANAGRAASRQRAGRMQVAAVVGAGLLLAGLTAVAAMAILYVYRPLVAVRRAAVAVGTDEVEIPERGPRELREIAVALNQRARSLVEQREAQLTFLASVAHELRNPLMAMSLSVEQLCAHRNISDAQRQAAAARVKRQIARLTHMVSDVLDSSRIEAGHFRLELSREDLRPIVEDAAALYADLSLRHRIEVTLPETPVLVRGDAVRLGQVMTNLVSNAIKYAPEGGRVGVSLREEGGAAVLEVSDEGVGIAEAEQARIFEPYRRSGTSRGDVPGAGLGLAVVKRIVEAHGGALSVRSAPGQGSTFSVRLPVLLEDTPWSSTSATPAAPPPRSSSTGEAPAAGPGAARWRRSPSTS